jgi:hypothetical protein
MYSEIILLNEKAVNDFYCYVKGAVEEIEHNKRNYSLTFLLVVWSLPIPFKQH